MSGSQAVGRAVTVTARPLSDYRHMFALDDGALRAGPILDCPAGASPFGAQARARGGCVVSADPIYRLGAGQIVERVRANLKDAGRILTAPGLAIDWDYLGSPDAYVRACEVAADLFAADYARNGRYYVAAAMPALPFRNRSFHLTLSSHLLFVYSANLSFGDHLAALAELVRVTHGEVRVHPVANATGATYPRLGELRTALLGREIVTDLRPVARTWITGARQMLVCRAR